MAKRTADGHQEAYRPRCAVSLAAAAACAGDRSVSFAESPEELKRTTVEEYASRLRSGGAENFVFGAFDGSQLVGMTGFYRDALLKRRHIGHIWGVFVSPSARGKVLGRALLVEVIESAKAIPGVRCIRLMVAVTQEAARH